MSSTNLQLQEAETAAKNTRPTRSVHRELWSINHYKNVNTIQYIHEFTPHLGSSLVKLYNAMRWISRHFKGSYRKPLNLKINPAY